MHRRQFTIEGLLGTAAALHLLGPQTGQAQGKELRKWGFLLEGLTETETRWLHLVNAELGGHLENQLGYRMKMKVYTRPDMFRSDLMSAQLHYGAISTYQYVTENKLDRLGIAPSLIAYNSKDGNETFSLLCAKNSGITRPEQLQGESINVYFNGTEALIYAWLRSVMGAETNPTTTQTDTPKNSVYPVFYGQRKACVIPTHVLLVLQDLNPQFGNRLIELARSPSLPTGLVFCHSSLSTEDRKRFQTAALEFVKGARGEQLINLTRIGSLKAYEEKLLDGVRNVVGTKAPPHILNQSLPREGEP